MIKETVMNIESAEKIKQDEGGIDTFQRKATRSIN